MTVLASTVRPADGAAIADAARILKRGGLVAFPTETVYGLGADARNDSAVAAIYAAKGRPRFNPLIVHVADLSEAETHAGFGDTAQRLAQTFWPGPLTLVLPRRAGCKLSALVSAGLDTVALRVPSHPVARRLLEAAQMPIAAPSANPSGRISPTRAEHVAEGFGDKVDLVLDAGATPVGIESTVIGFANGRPVLLRPGGIAREAIEALTGRLAPSEAGKVSSPGQLESHYAPRTPLRLNAKEVEHDEALLAFGPAVPQGARVALNLSAAGNLDDAASNLFAMLRALDKTGVARIAVMPIPHTGLGEAINDRLKRAAAPRGDFA